MAFVHAYIYLLVYLVINNNVVFLFVFLETGNKNNSAPIATHNFEIMDFTFKIDSSQRPKTVIHIDFYIL